MADFLFFISRLDNFSNLLYDENVTQINYDGLGFFNTPFLNLMLLTISITHIASDLANAA